MRTFHCKPANDQKLEFSLPEDPFLRAEVIKRCKAVLQTRCHQRKSHSNFEKTCTQNTNNTRVILSSSGSQTAGLLVHFWSGRPSPSAVLADFTPSKQAMIARVSLPCSNLPEVPRAILLRGNNQSEIRTSRIKPRPRRPKIRGTKISLLSVGC